MKRRQPNKWRHLQTDLRRDADGGGADDNGGDGRVPAKGGIEASAAEARTVALAIQHSLKNMRAR